MHALVVYETTHGNTERIAHAIGQAIGSEARKAGDLSAADLARYDLVIIGSPTHGGFPVEEVHALLEAAPDLGGVDVAAFDTRTATIWNKLLPFGYAAPRIAQSLERSGGHLLAPPAGFVVEGIKGPIREGELERAAAWAKGLIG